MNITRSKSDNKSYFKMVEDSFKKIKAPYPPITLLLEIMYLKNLPKKVYFTQYVDAEKPSFHILVSEIEKPTENIFLRYLDAPAELLLKLRIRNKQGALVDIYFDYKCKKESCYGVAKDLVLAGLLEPVDEKEIAEAIPYLLSIRYNHRISNPSCSFFLDPAFPKGVQKLRRSANLRIIPAIANTL